MEMQARRVRIRRQPPGLPFSLRNGVGPWANAVPLLVQSSLPQGGVI